MRVTIVRGMSATGVPLQAFEIRGPFHQSTDGEARYTKVLLAVSLE
jgi:hypothetical protein